jgi:hypothetical protein
MWAGFALAGKLAEERTVMGTHLKVITASIKTVRALFPATLGAAMWGGLTLVPLAAASPFILTIWRGMRGAKTSVGLDASEPLAVNLANFSAEAEEDAVHLYWETVSELDHLGFNISRSTTAEGVQLNSALIPAQAPGSGQGASYSYEDGDVEGGITYYYSLEEVDVSGNHTQLASVSATVNAPTAITVGELATRESSHSWLFLTALLLLLAIAGLASSRAPY